MKTIVCTTGTSIAKDVPREVQSKGGAAFREAIRQRLATLAESLEVPSLLKQASAESNSVSRLGPESGDLVVLLHSETEDGTICAEEVQRLLRDQLHADVECKRIDGLQATDPTRFRRLGVQNLFAELDRRCASNGSVFLNVTGGFKSAVPYVTLYGILHQVPVVYIFELSDSLFTLPQPPVHFDYDRLAPAADAIAMLHRETAMPREEFFRRVPGIAYHERPLYEPLLDEENGQVMLSAFGLLFHEALQRDRGNVFLSPNAAKTFSAATGDAREQLAFMLERVGNPLIRRAKRHPFHGTDLEVYKPGNTAQRMAYFMKGNDVHVCELYPAHDEGYERRLASKRVADYHDDHFAPWSRPVEMPKGPETDEEWAIEQSKKLALLEKTVELKALDVASLEQDVAKSHSEITGAHLRFEAAMVERDAVVEQLNEARVLEDSLRNKSLEHAATADRMKRFEREASWIDRLRFVLTARLP